jgi:hypothetical protein
MEAAVIKDGRINRAALVKLATEAMASGVACALERMLSGEVDPGAPLSEVFGDFPDEWIDIRSDLVDALLAVGDPR